ncbi:MAG: glycosyltransferase family 2 protein [Saccharofermentans sp.]|jgi:glycosyltransferase involved in cell wall biosynthesis|nr:glycosyltransferase family 2 protein [Mageeibacillus sp.]MCI1264495.1 glycosyltransferase family 2 protein [Saccharofermentans sp.]MCI1275601.1 glycosyltransferase family 2 protein [Saccharofermentans sp.]MCI1768857.1 glycosyltransferase family 2 protein [Mageeibacillus sp.]
MIISLIVPCYNEEESLPFLYKALCEVRSSEEGKGREFEFIFVNDGSCDNTLKVIKDFAASDSSVRYVSLSRNFGKESAMYAGLRKARGGYVAILDADMQDPPSLIPQMIKDLDSGNWDIVAARRVTRAGEPRIRSFFARTFYKLINRMCDVEIADGARDFRLMRREVVDAILLLSERQRFSKGIFSWVGFRTKWLEHENTERVAGETKWSFWKLFRYAVDGIVSFTIAPLRLATYAGFASAFAAFIYLIYYFIRAVILRIYDTVPGYPSLLCFMLFIGGLILMALGLLGEYIGRTYIETKGRPIYISAEESPSKPDEDLCSRDNLTSQDT